MATRKLKPVLLQSYARWLLEPAASRLAAGQVPFGVRGVAVRLVAGFVIGAAARVHAGVETLGACGVASLVAPGRSAGVGADVAECAGVDGHRVGDVSAPEVIRPMPARIRSDVRCGDCVSPQLTGSTDPQQGLPNPAIPCGSTCGHPGAFK